MADTLQFELVSPERRVVSVAATRVEVPGVAGDFTAMPNHAPFMATLRPGIVRVTAGASVAEFVVTGGFVEVSPAATTILAEQAAPRDGASREMLAEVMAEAERAVSQAAGDVRQAADQRLRDLRILSDRLAS